MTISLWLLAAVLYLIGCMVVAWAVGVVIDEARDRRRSARLYAEAMRTQRRKLRAMPRRNGDEARHLAAREGNRP